MPDEITPNEVLPAALKHLREARGWSQNDLAKALEGRWPSGSGRIDRPTITRIERGDRKVTVDEAFAFAAILGVSPLALMVPSGTLQDTDGRHPPALFQIAPGLLQDDPWRIVTWFRGLLPLELSDPEAHQRFDAGRPDFEKSVLVDLPLVTRLQEIVAIVIRHAANKDYKSAAKVLEELQAGVKDAIHAVEVKDATRSLPEIVDLLKGEAASEHEHRREEAKRSSGRDK